MYLNKQTALHVALFFFGLFGFAASWSVQAERITVAVAANIAPVMRVLSKEFTHVSGHSVALAVGASGKFVAQIQQNAPFHLFFSADQAKPAALEASGHAVSGSRFTYAIGALVLWSPEHANEDAAAILRQGDYKRLAMANPRLAPYGSAAVEVAEALGLSAQSRARWIQGENIAQTYQFVVSRNADLGFVALSQVLQHNERSYWRIPQTLYTPIKQDAVLLRHGAHSAAARAFLDYICSEPARAHLREWGYEAPACIADTAVMQ